MTLYENGSVVGTLGSVNGTILNQNVHLRFGGAHGAGGGNPHYFDGIIDEIRISNTNRSANWISTEYNNQNSPATFYTVSSEFTAATLCATLPIELIDFDAKAIVNDYVKLDWQTASESQNDFFTIERSKNGIIWEEINRITGAENSSTLLNYSIMDYNPHTGLSYYRLKQTDFDGEFEYSLVRSVNITTDNNINIFPNPASNQITITGKQIAFEEINFYNTLGQNVTALTQQSIKNGGQLIIDLSRLSQGMYYIKTKNKVFKILKE
tara:strand:- start:36 stop:836 length:801 start_codon:yes stop_codon:yes gene_type:complete